MMPNTLILGVGEGVIKLFSTYLLLYKSRRTPPPKYSHGIIKCRLDVYIVFCRSLDKSAAQLERQRMALLSRYHSLQFDIAFVPDKQPHRTAHAACGSYLSITCRPPPPNDTRIYRDRSFVAEIPFDFGWSREYSLHQSNEAQAYRDDRRNEYQAICSLLWCPLATSFQAPQAYRHSTPNIPKKRKLEIRDALTTPFHKKLSQNETLEPPPSEMLPSPAKDVANPNDRPMGLHGPEINLLQRSRDCRYSSFAADSMSSPETASLTTACALLGSESRTDPVSSISAMPSPPYNLPSFSAHSIYRLAATECIPGGKNHMKKTAVDRILTDPSMVQRHLLVLQQELKRNRDAFYQALQRRNVMERENLKKEKRHLLQQQAVWLSVARSLQSYKGLMLQRDALIERAVEAYDQSIDTKEYERSMGEIELKLSEQ
ncbi:uncharacterized protein PG998_014655 [Apiospora kogelbergensis]|uniref:uncharacterized protein n=1 Tax=Apiospora kogelbergensis TaxID=1337665 RepID=UPI00312EABE2